MRIDIVSVFPDYLRPLELSLIGKAIANGLIDLRVHDLRDYTEDRHRTVDDTPYGGGPGMVMKAEPWGRAFDEILSAGDGAATPTVVVPTPSGPVFTQALADEFSTSDWLVFACARYEGIDSRVVDDLSERNVDVREVSIGDYVLAGGEAAALVIVEASVRLIPGVLGNEESARDDSFGPNRFGGELEGPIYTKPREWRGKAVPDVLLSGDHAAVARWRVEQSKARTAQVRPDLS